MRRLLDEPDGEPLYVDVPAPTYRLRCRVTHPPHVAGCTMEDCDCEELEAQRARNAVMRCE